MENTFFVSTVVTNSLETILKDPDRRVDDIIASEAQTVADDLEPRTVIRLLDGYQWGRDDSFSGPLDALPAWGADELDTPIRSGLTDTAAYILRTEATATINTLNTRLVAE